jgi:hypothetical protein
MAVLGQSANTEFLAGKEVRRARQARNRRTNQL